LQHRKRSGRSRAGTKGFSSIVGAVFMVLIMGVLAYSYFIFTLSENTVYNDAVRQKNQLDLNRMSERATVSNTTYSVNSNSNVTVIAQIQNTGPSSIQFITIWIYVSNSTWTNYNFSKLTNASVQGGGVFPLNVNMSVSGVNSVAAYTFASWLVTARGNVVPLQQIIVSANNIIVAQVAQGIGSISFNFDQFWHYDFSSTPAEGTVLPSANPLNYTVSESKYTVYHVMLMDLDPNGQNIVLNGNSSIYIIGQHSGTVKYATWNLVNVTNNKIYPSSNARNTLMYRVATELYFAGMISSIDTDNAYPLNILLMGTKGASDYGQNIPFVSIYLTL
jgi:hypothetical protein